MRQLLIGQLCEHEEIVYRDGALTKARCTVRHHDRSSGPPQQLVPVREGRTVRFKCLKHAPSASKTNTVKRQKRGKPPAEQMSLV